MSEPDNPWLTAPGTELPAEEATPAEEPPRPAPGPAAPQAGVPEPPASERLPRVQTDDAAAIWWVGAHGGAGETTLAALVPGSRAGGHAWPIASDPPVSLDPVPIVLVARTSMSGIRAAQRAATDWATNGVPQVQLLGLVWIADAPGKLPRTLREFADVVSGGVPRVWHLPWIESWRIGAEPSIDSSPKQVRRLVKDVRALVSEIHAADRGIH